MKKLSEEELLVELGLYNHSVDGQVKFHEVDSFGVLHNIQYFYILEWARTKYLEEIGVKLDNGTFTKHTPIMTVHHEIDYLNPIKFYDNYKALSRITKVGKSSLFFNNIILSGDKVLATASCILVYLDESDLKPTRIPEDIREKISQHEGINVVFKD